MIESFTFDHTTVEYIPYVRLSKALRTSGKNHLLKFDVRIKRPNGGDYLNPKVIHTLEHMFSVELEKYIDDTNATYFDFSPMGCQTGFYLSFIVDTENINHSPGYINIMESYVASIMNVVCIRILGNKSYKTDIPFANEIQCGNYKLFDLDESIKVVKELEGKFKAFGDKGND